MQEAKCREEERVEPSRGFLPAPYSRKMYNKDTNPEGSKGLLSPLDSDAALNAAWARRAGMVSYLPRSARVVCRPAGRAPSSRRFGLRSARRTSSRTAEDRTTPPTTIMLKSAIKGSHKKGHRIPEALRTDIPVEQTLHSHQEQT